MEYVLAGLAWVGGSLLAALGWSRFFRGMDTLPDPADAAPDLADTPPIPVQSETNWEAEYQRARTAEVTEVTEERTAPPRSA